MKRYGPLLGYAARYRAGWVLIVVLTVLSTAFTLVQPWPLKVLVDNVLRQQPLSGGLSQVAGILPGANTPQVLLIYVVLASLLIFAASSALEVVLTTSWVRVGQRMVYDLAHDLFARVQRRSLIFHSRNSVGDSLARITGDSWGLHTVVDTLLFAPAHALITSAAVVVVMWHMDSVLTLLALAVLPFMAGSSLLLGRPIRLAARATREVESRIHSHVQQTLAGIPVVQVFAQEEREHTRFREYAARSIRARRRTALMSGLNSLSSGLVSAIATAAILWFGASHVLQGSLTVGSILVFVAYLGVLQSQLKALTGINAALQGAAASVDRLLEVLETEPEVKDRPGAYPLPPAREGTRGSGGEVLLDNVTFGYEPGIPVLSDVTLYVQPGQTVAVVGPTGAGKSTLAAMIARFFDPWAGAVLIDGHDIRDIKLSSLREQVALVLQDPFLFPISVAQNIAYGCPHASDEEIRAAAMSANAHEFIMRLPEGYDTVVGERAGTLSGGEKQRISIARALLKDAPILILDEPTSALDARTEGALMGAIEHLKEERTGRGRRTTFIIAHRLSTIRNADQIVVMERGRIVEVGSHDELLLRGSSYTGLYNAQWSWSREQAKAG